MSCGKNGLVWILWILWITVSSATTRHEAILQPPYDAVVNIGKTAKFECELALGDMRTMKWTFNDVIVYFLLENKEDYPIGHNKYSVTKEGNEFTLTVSDLSYSDAGFYTCAGVTVKATANLIVLGPLSLTTSMPYRVEGNTAVYTCEAHFRGPDRDKISLNHFPQLHMFCDDRHFQSTQYILEPTATRQNYILRESIAMALTVGQNGKQVTCELKISEPDVSKTNVTTISVFYPPRIIKNMFHLRRYVVGKKINCTARGNPEPHVQWENFAKQGDYKGTALSTSMLQITKDMVGRNSWICIATNVINGESHRDILIHKFEVQRYSRDFNVPHISNSADTTLSSSTIISFIGTVTVIITTVGYYCH